MAYGILISMAADVARIKKDMDSAKSAVSGGVKQITKVLGTIGAALSAGVVANYFKDITLGSIRAADDLDELAQKVGVSADFLASMQLASELTGTSLDGLATSVKFLGKNISEAVVAPAGEMAAVFRDLGISLVDASGAVRKSEDVWLEMADVMAGLEQSPHKVAAAMKVLGKGAAEVGALMNLGRDGIEELRQEAIALGLVLDSDTRNKLGSLNDAIDKLSKLSTGLGNAIAKEVLPTVSGIAAAMLDAAKKTDAFKIVAQSVHGVLKILASGAAIVATAIKNMAIGFAAPLAAIKTVISSGNIQKGLDVLAMAFSDVTKNSQDNAKFLEQLWSETLPQLAKATSKATVETKELTRAKMEDKKEVTTLISSLRDQIAVMEKTLALGRELNAAEQLRLKIIGDLEDGSLELGATEAKRVDHMLRMLDLRIREKADRDNETKAIEETIKENQAILDLIRAQEMENKTIGLTRVEVEKLALARHDARIDYLEGQIIENMGSEEQIALMQIQLDLLKKLREGERQGFEKRNDPSAVAGLRKAWTEFREQVGEVSRDMETVFNKAVSGMENVFVEFLTKGKADFKSFVEAMGQELLRLAFRRALLQLGESLFGPGPGSSSGGGGGGGGGGIFSSSSAPTTGFSVASAAAASSGPAVTVNITNNIDSRSDQATIAAANERTRKQVVSEVSNLMRRDSPMFAR